MQDVVTFICWFKQSVDEGETKAFVATLPYVANTRGKSSPQVNRPVYRRGIDEAPFTILPLVTDMKYGRARVHGAGRRFHGNPGQATLLLLPDICLRRTYTHVRVLCAQLLGEHISTLVGTFYKCIMIYKIF